MVVARYLNAWKLQFFFSPWLLWLASTAGGSLWWRVNNKVLWWHDGNIKLQWFEMQLGLGGLPTQRCLPMPISGPDCWATNCQWNDEISFSPKVSTVSAVISNQHWRNYASYMVVYFYIYCFKWPLVCKFGIMEKIFSRVSMHLFMSV